MKQAFLIIPIFLAGCATVPGEASSAGAYRALGTEPFWSLTIGDGRMALETPDGPERSVAAPAPRPTATGRIYETDQLVLEVVTAGPCSDGMSDRLYADTVTVRLDGATLNGCGGSILPPGRLADTSWSIVEIGAAPVIGENYHLEFTADRISGQAGCNRFSGAYTQSDGTIVPGPIMATRMACPEPRMTHEQLVLGLLSGPVRFEHPDGDTLVLSGHGGAIRLRRSI